MSILFAGKVGSVVAFDDPALQCSMQLFGIAPAPSGESIDFEHERSIVTRVTVAQQVNLQFLHTIGAQIYVYVFGDRMGQIGLSGLSFLCDCNDATATGAEQILLWYRRNRASRRKSPLRVMIGNQALDGFVINFTQDVVDPALSIVQWGLSLAALPEDD